MKTRKDLEVWKKSIDFVTVIYKSTQDFPKSEIYGLVQQMRRCAVSVPSNIAEGAARISKKEFVHFLSMSLGSLSELETQLIISSNLKYISVDNLEELMNELITIRKMLIGLKRSIKPTD